MKKFAGGLLLGMLAAGSVSALASAGIFGSGPLKGWSVTKDGEEICSTPSVNVRYKEIECD